MIWGVFQFRQQDTYHTERNINSTKKFLLGNIIIFNIPDKFKSLIYGIVSNKLSMVMHSLNPSTGEVDLCVEASLFCIEFQISESYIVKLCLQKKGSSTVSL